MVCLRRLCKRYRCWTTLTENGGVDRQRRVGVLGRDPLSCPLPGSRQRSKGPSAAGPDRLLTEASAVWDQKAGFLGSFS